MSETRHTDGERDILQERRTDEWDAVEDAKRQHTPKTWHVNAIKGNRIIGDETAEEWDKLHINGGNRTIARVYRAPDARLIAAAPEMLEALRYLVQDIDAQMHGARAVGYQDHVKAARAIIRKATGQEA